MSVKITYFVHGTTTDNEQGLATGQLPGELSELGKKQATELGRLIANQKFDAVFCSDLKRAVDSAELGFGYKYQIIEDKRLREANYGNFNGKPENKFKNNLALYINNPFPDGESLKDVEKRLRNFCKYLLTNYSDKHIAIVAHQAPQLALEVILKNKTWVQVISEDWRKTKSWQPGWKYEINN
jgi:broad specificity phosphatase PhoE